MSRNVSRQSPEVSPAIKLAARQRVEAVGRAWMSLCPDMTLQAKKVLAEKVLDLSRGEEQKPPRIMITPAQDKKHYFPNMQCINPCSPMLLFSNRSQDELNQFFKVEE